MGTFTLTQQQDDKDIYYYPNAAGCNTDFTPIGAANNWQCVDEPQLSPDEDTTYIYNGSVLVKYDLYELPNHTTESGTINYIQVYARGKTYNATPGTTDSFKIIITENNCGNIYKSEDKNLLTNYRTYHEVWTVNPRSDATWTWSDIDNLEIGVECQSPNYIETEQTLTLRPNGNNDIELTPKPASGTNWQEVDEVAPDWNGTYVFWNSDMTKKRDLYDIPDHTTESGVISSVTIYNYNRSLAGGTSYHYTYLKTHGTEYDVEHFHPNPGTQWTLYSDEYLTNPFTNDAWTWDEIDDLLIGTGIKYGNQYGQSTQVYAIVRYTSIAGPQIRLSQAYVKINYTTSSTCTLQKPDEISVDHQQNIKMLNFWSGNRAVYGLTRSGRTMVLTGIQYSSDADDVMDCVRSMGEDGSQISIAGLNNNNFNQSFRIASFGQKKISEEPLAYRWILECEYTD